MPTKKFTLPAISLFICFVIASSVLGYVEKLSIGQLTEKANLTVKEKVQPTYSSWEDFSEESRMITCVTISVESWIKRGL